MGNLDRFSGFADLYDANRPTPPEALGPLLSSYAQNKFAHVVDLGSGTGLSTRWAASWAASVVGVEPNPDMRSEAQRHLHVLANVSYRPGTSDATGIDTSSADIVLAVQAMHWMEPTATLAEVSRLLRPGGVFAVIDADWPPIAGNADAEAAWMVVQRRIHVLEARLARGEHIAEMRRPNSDDDDDLRTYDVVDPHRDRLLPNGVKSWSKSGHLQRLADSRRFAFVRELIFHQPTHGGEERFIALKRSQGSYQGLQRAGLSDDDMGFSRFERDVQAAFAAHAGPIQLAFAWRVRFGVKAR